MAELLTKMPMFENGVMIRSKFATSVLPNFNDTLSCDIMADFMRKDFPRSITILRHGLTVIFAKIVTSVKVQFHVLWHVLT